MKRKTACIISLTPVTDEPRVRRQSQALHQAGWDVIVAGYKGRSPKPPYWKLIEIENICPTLSMMKRQGLWLKKKLCLAVEDFAEDYYWWSAGYAGMFERLAWVDGVRCDLAVSHDYFTAPIAARLASRCGVNFVLDCHEYAVEQYAHRLLWRLEERPWVWTLQRRFINRASVVTTVCEGISGMIQRDYRLSTAPLVVRSLPFYQSLPFRPVGTPIVVLYHGNLSPQRGLEVTVKSVALWRPEFRLLLRGPGSERYLGYLRLLAERHGVSHRVSIEPPVPFPDIIPAANHADIGFFVQEDLSLHKHFALPNKLFDYIMAGTAICVADLPEMARVVTDHGVGRLVRQVTPEGIAEVINSFSRDDINGYKQRSLEAARELCWEREAPAMVTAYEKASEQRAAPVIH
jgi:glycosyltransferase involved in cell wall biosynthesis